MPRVIAVQEEQMRMIREKYKNATPSISAPQSNAGILSETFSATPTATSVDMESQVVNLSPNPVAQTPSVVDGDVTSQVFGPGVFEAPLMPNSEVTPVIPATDMTVSQDKVDYPTSVSLDGVSEETSMAATLVDGMNDETIKLFNSLRDKLTTFYNETNSEIDKIQEQILNQSKVGFEDSKKNENIQVVQPERPEVGVSQNDFATGSGGTNIFDVNPDLDKTVVIPVADIGAARTLEETAGPQLAA